MAGTAPTESQNEGCSFQWDETSGLYFHSSSGFYHDPSAGWYYSSSDGLYYKFENGNYVLLGPEFNKAQGDECETYDCGVHVADNLIQDETCSTVRPNDDVDLLSLLGDEAEASQGIQNTVDDPNSVDKCNSEYNKDQVSENPPPPSEWLEETLIELYLSGYSNIAANLADDPALPSETEEMDNSKLLADEQDSEELEEGEWIPDDHHGLTDMSGSALDEDALFNEEMWRAQYGQVIQSEEEPVAQFPFVDLWDWKVITGPRKNGKGEVARLLGRLVKRSAKLHPSMPSGGGLLKTAPICETRLDLVRVRTGQVYKLHCPNASYMSSLSTYDSSDPTKDWGFPELSITKDSTPQNRYNEKNELKTTDGTTVYKDSSMLPNEVPVVEKHKSRAYRDRAAERRTLHGGFGVGPGQKKLGGDDGDPSSDSSTEEAAAQALNMSFGSGSYARKILEGMGWKEGEALGNTTKGLVEPIQAIGNIGSAGLGWPQGRAKFR